MANVLTPTYDFTQPEVGGADDQWGDLLNANWGKVDTLLTEAFIGGSPSTVGTGLKITGIVPQVRYFESDQTAPAGEYREVVSNDIFMFQRSLTAAFATVTTIWKYTGSTGMFEIEAPLTLSGDPLTIINTTPVLRFKDSDAGATGGQYALRVNGNDWDFLRFTAANFGGTTTLWKYDGAAAAVTFSVPVSIPTIQSAVDVAGGTVKIIGTGPQLRLEESDQTNPAGRYRLLVTSDSFLIQRSGSGDYTTSTPVFGYVGSTDLTLTYGLTRLASQSGDVEIGSGAGSTLKFNRTAGPAAIIVQSDASLRVQSAGGTTWATVSNGAGWVAGSDERMKHGITAYTGNALALVERLRPVHFHWNDTDEADLGLIAQAVRGVLPEAVAEMQAEVGEVPLLGMRDRPLVTLLIKAVQELTQRLRNLEEANA